MNDTLTALAPAGWYPDHLDPRQVRWWDGAGWTHHVELIPRSAFQNGVAVNRMRDIPLVTSAEALRAAAGFGPAE